MVSAIDGARNPSNDHRVLYQTSDGNAPQFCQAKAKCLSHFVPFSLFPSQGPTLTPSISTLPLSSWWEVLGNHSSKMVGIQVQENGDAPTVVPPSLPLDQGKTVTIPIV